MFKKVRFDLIISHFLQGEEKVLSSERSVDDFLLAMGGFLDRQFFQVFGLLVILLLSWENMSEATTRKDLEFRVPGLSIM